MTVRTTCITRIQEIVTPIKTTVKISKFISHIGVNSFTRLANSKVLFAVASTYFLSELICKIWKAVRCSIDRHTVRTKTT